MSNLTSAKSQKAEDKPISFVLQSADGSMKSVSLFIRPEDMSIVFPSRMSVNQTLGGAWIDAFGEGLQQATISGTTGWHTAPDGKDGIDRLIQLKNEFFTKWHDLRAAAIKAGNDPNKVKLRFVDNLNRYSRVIAPGVFEVRRSKSRPLLAMYRFSFTAVANPKAAAAVKSALSLDPSGFGLSSLLSSLNTIKGYINSAKTFINTQILAPVKAFMNMSHQLLTAVQSTIAAGVSLAGSVISVARAIAQTGVNIFRTLASVAGIPALMKATLMQVASAYSNIFCVLKNALKAPKTYENYTSLYGASNCSSTSGGSPASQYANVNAFYSVAPAASTYPSVSTEAMSSMNAIIKSDVVLAPMTVQQIGAGVATINAGVKLA